MLIFQICISINFSYDSNTEASNKFNVFQSKSYTLSPSILSSENIISIEYHKKDRGEKDERVMLDVYLYTYYKDEGIIIIFR